MKNKYLIRKRLKEKRSSLSANYCNSYEEIILKIVLKFIKKYNSSKIGLYVSCGNEVRTINLIDKIISLEKEVYLPVQNFVDETLIFASVVTSNTFVSTPAKVFFAARIITLPSLIVDT